MPLFSQSQRIPWCENEDVYCCMIKIEWIKTVFYKSGGKREPDKDKLTKWNLQNIAYKVKLTKEKLTKLN